MANRMISHSEVHLDLKGGKGSRIFSIDTLPVNAVQTKRVLLRVDFNVPLLHTTDERNNEVTAVADETRIRAVLPTIRLLVSRNAKVILVSHLGRPQGKDPRQSLRPVAAALSRLLHPVPIVFVEDCMGEEVKAAVGRMSPGTVLLLENTRFYEGENTNDEAFAAELASSVHADVKYCPSIA